MRGIRTRLLVAFAALITVSIAGVLPALAGSWSPPVQLPATCGSSLAVDAAGASATAGFYQSSDLTYHMQVCTSPDGTAWSSTNLDVGRNPAVAMARDGRAVAVWGSVVGCPASCSYPAHASVRPPGGSWSAPVTISTDIAVERGAPVVRIDGSGNAIAAWVEHNGNLVHIATLPAGGTWSADATLSTVTNTFDPALAVNSAGSAIVSFASGNNVIRAASGTVLGGFAVPVEVALAGASYRAFAQPRLALDDSGLASLVWAANGKTSVATRTPDGIWSAPTVLATQFTTPDTAIDGSGNAIAIFGSSYSWRLAGGGWGPATALPSGSSGGRVVADAAGTFVYVDGGANGFTFKAGAGFGPGTAVCSCSGPSDLQIVPGRVALLCGDAVSSQPVS